MTKEAMIKVLRYKAEHIKAKIKPEFFAEVADMLEQEPKTGHWIYDGDQIICNRCFKAFGFISLKLTSNYCPDCGAKMADEVIVE